MKVQVGKKRGRKKGVKNKVKEHILVPPGTGDALALKAQDVGIGIKDRCTICNNTYMRFIVMDMYSKGCSLNQIVDAVRKQFVVGTTHATLKEHLEHHEHNATAWMGLVKYKFASDEERQKFEAAFLSRISLVTEMWDRYQTIAELFEIVVGVPGNVSHAVAGSVGRLDSASKLAGEMRQYLTEMLKLQKEKDLVVETAKMILFFLADKLVSRLAFVVTDLPLERKEMIGKIISEETKNAIDHAKGLARMKTDDLIKKINEEYEKFTHKSGDRKK